MGAGALGRWVWASLGLALWAGAAAGVGVRAQGPADAVVRGAVRDARGAPVAGAEVRLVSAESGTVAYAETGRGGEFGFLAVPVGEYVASVRFPVAPMWVGAVRVPAGVGESAGLELSLRASGDGLAATADEARDAGGALDGVLWGGLGWGEWGWGGLGLRGAAEGLEGEAEVSSAARDGVLAGGGSAQDPDEAEESASAREEREAGASAGAAMRADGLLVLERAPLVDGVSTEQGFGGGARGGGLGGGGERVGSGFRQSGVTRWASPLRGFSAQIGGAGGARAGSSGGVPARARAGVHGQGFAQARESAWGAVNPYSVVTTYAAGQSGAALVRPADSDVRFGVAAGDAVRWPGLSERWQTGLFGAVEGRERRQTMYSSPETSGFYDLSANQKALLANRGVSEAQTRAALAFLSGLSGAAQLWGSQWVGRGRAEVAPGRWDRVSVGFEALRSDTPAVGGGQIADGVVNRALGSVGTRSMRVDAGTARWVHELGPRWTNEVRAQVSREVVAETPGAGLAGVAPGTSPQSASGLGAPEIGPGGLAPQVAIAPEGFSYGTPASLGRVAYPDERRLEVGESTRWRFGRHLLTVGGDWSRVDDRVLGATNTEGSFLYDSGTTGGYAGGLVDWISDYTYNVRAYPNGACPSVTAATHYFCFRSYAQSFAGSEAEFVTHEVAGFAEDAVRLRPGLTMTLGARWEYELLPFPLLPNAALDEALRASGAEGSAAFGSTASFPEDRNNVGPRVAVSWSPGVGRPHGMGRGRAGWVTVRAGYGVFFGRVPGATLHAALTETGLGASTTRIRITPKVETVCPQVPGQGFGYPCAFPYAPTGVAPVAQTGSAVVFAQRFRLPVVQRATLEVERELGRRMTVRAGYSGAWATQLPETTDLNIAPSTSTVSYVVQGGDGRRGLWTGQSFQVPLYTARRTTKFGPVTAIVSNANATYHSGTAEATLRGWHGWGARGSFTFSKAVDYGPQVGPTPRQDGQFDPFTDGYDKGISSLDRPWGVAGAVTWRSPGEVSGPEWRRWLLDGWGAAATGRAGSGAPYSYVIFGGTRLAGGHESVNGSGGATYLPTVGRNTLRLPMRSAMDVRASREVGLGRRLGRNWRLQMRGEAFNVLNTVSVSRVETRAFLLGTPGSVGGMTPLVFQDAAAVASEGVSTPAFGTPLSSTTGLSRERTVEVGVGVRF